MNQIGFNNTANIGTYNDVAGNQINNYPVVENQEQADFAVIRSLKIANTGENQHQTCADNTRVHILQDIHTWAEDTTTKSQIFWLADLAGTGKSTVAKQIVKDRQKAAMPVASFFFSTNSVDTLSNAKFCPTIAAKLAELRDFGSFRSTLAEALRQKLTVETSDFGDQFEGLLYAPLKKTDMPLLIIVDALDECDKRGRSELLSVLLSKLVELPMVKIMITSRPEPDIVELLQKREVIRSSDIRGSGNADSSIQDVLRYVSYSFANSDRLRRFQSHVPKVAEAANGLFIYASTACEHLKNSPRLKAELKALDRIRGLDDLYSRIMKRAIPENDDELYQAVSSILQIVLAAQRPLSILEIEELLGDEDLDIGFVVGTLASVLGRGAEDRPIEIFHPTFREYLTDENRSKAYFVNLKMGHESLAVGCLKFCGVESTTFPKEEAPVVISPTLEYAARYWPVHVTAFFREANSQDNAQSLESQIISFFKQGLIHWFELTVRIEAVSQCIKNLALLGTIAVIASATATDLASKTFERKRWCRDSQRFLQHHQSVIEQGYIHVRGALAFTPKESPVRKTYFAMFAPGIPAVLSGTRTNWPSHQRLSGHTRAVNAVAFSPDGSRVISGSGDHTLRLWDCTTGASISGPMRGHTNKVTQVAFSPDGTRAISGSSDFNLRLWDGVTGTSIGGLMRGHTHWITHVAFSPDGTRVLSTSYDNTVRIWDGVTGAGIGGSISSGTVSPDSTRVISCSSAFTLQLWDGVTGAKIGGPMDGHTAMVRSVAFSPDGTRVVSGSSDKTLRLWDGATGASINGPMSGHTKWVRTVAFSPDGARVVSSSDDHILQLWDGVTGAKMGAPMDGHTQYITCVTFSPNGTRLISRSSDLTVRLWDGVTGASIGVPMETSTNKTASIAFSPDGTRVVWCASDCTLQLWDSATGLRLGEPMKGHDRLVVTTVFSPDGTRIVSGSHDCTLRLWNGVTGASIGGPMVGHGGYVLTVAFSPDGTRVVSTALDSTLRLWNGMIGVGVEGHNGHTAIVNNIVFSPDGTRVVSISSDRILQLWDSATGANIGGPMKGHTGTISDVAFSPDSSRILSAAFYDEKVRLWDTVTGAYIGGPINKRTQHSTQHSAEFAFSPDGTRVVSSSKDHSLRLWDGVTSENISGPMRGHTDRITCVAFSPDGTRVISGSLDHTLRLWDGIIGASIAGPMSGHTEWINRVVFSPDSTHIVSSSNDNTLRLWDGVTGGSIGAPRNGQTRRIEIVAFSPDGSRIVSATVEPTFWLWDGMTSVLVGRPMRGHTHGITNLLFSPDSSRILSAALDHTLRLWDVSSYGEVAVIDTKVINPVRFSTCGSYILSGPRIWDIRLLPPTPVTGTNPSVSTPPFSPICYNRVSRMIEIHTSSVLTFPVFDCQVSEWASYGGCIALGLGDGRVVIIDCTHLL